MVNFPYICLNIKTMKTLIATVLFSLVSLIGLSQNSSTPKDKYFSYAGDVTNGVLNLMTETEKYLLSSALSELNVSIDTIAWVQSDMLDNLSEDKLYYSSKVVISSTNDNENLTDSRIGNHSLPIPQYIVFVYRNNDYSKVTVQMYY